MVEGARFRVQVLGSGFRFQGSGFKMVCDGGFEVLWCQFEIDLRRCMHALFLDILCSSDELR